MLDCLDRLADWDSRTRRRLAYLYAMSKDHPTSHGRRMARFEYKSLEMHMADTWDSWKQIKLALFPEKEKTDEARNV